MANFIISSPVSLPNHPLNIRVSEVMEDPGKFLEYDDETGEYLFRSSCTAHVYRQDNRLFHMNSLAPLLGKKAFALWAERLETLSSRYAKVPKQIRDFYWELEKRAAFETTEKISEAIFGEGFDPFSENNPCSFFVAARLIEKIREAEDVLELLGGEKAPRFEDYTLNRDAFFEQELRKIASFLDFFDE